MYVSQATYRCWPCLLNFLPNYHANQANRGDGKLRTGPNVGFVLSNGAQANDSIEITQGA